MALNIGTSGMTGLCYGTSGATKMYYGTDLVWTGGSNIDYSKEYLTFEIVSAGTLTFGASSTAITKVIEYSTDNGSTWTSWTGDTGNTAINVSAGDKVKVKGNNNQYASSEGKYTQFSGTSYFNVCGNIMSLLYGDNFTGQTSLIYGYTFLKLFNGSNIVSVENLIMPATTLRNYCYNGMFRNCTSLTSAPELPATTLKDYCYNEMFRGCTSLTSAPELPATTLASGCYYHMFNGCTSLTSAPALPATTLTGVCYAFMFAGCTSLTKAPELPATTLANYCYQNMFYSCSNLSYVKCLATDISASSCVKNWLSGVSATGTFVKAASMTSWPSGASGIPSGWTVQDAS